MSRYTKMGPLWTLAIPLLGIVAALAPGSARGQAVRDNDPNLQRIDVVEHLGEKIPLDLTFTDDLGRRVQLARYFGQGKPVILTLGYYECPMLCNLVFNGLSAGVSRLDWKPGKEFQMITVGIDPTESVELAHAKKINYLNDMDSTAAQAGWVFHVGTEDQIKKLADAVGFKYFYDEERDQYAHPAAAFVLTEDGTISRYLYGLEFKKQDLKLSLLEASDGKIGNSVDRLILYCFHYDPDAGSYVVFAGNVMRLGGLVVMLGLMLLIGLLWMGDRRRKVRRAARESHAAA